MNYALCIGHGRVCCQCSKWLLLFRRIGSHSRFTILYVISSCVAYHVSRASGAMQWQTTNNVLGEMKRENDNKNHMPSFCHLNALWMSSIVALHTHSHLRARHTPQCDALSLYLSLVLLPSFTSSADEQTTIQIELSDGCHKVILFHHLGPAFAKRYACHRMQICHCALRQ